MKRTLNKIDTIEKSPENNPFRVEETQYFGLLAFISLYEYNPSVRVQS